MSCQRGACFQTPNEASCQHSYDHVCGMPNQQARSPHMTAGDFQFTDSQVLQGYSVGEMRPGLMDAIAELLDLNKNAGTRKLADSLHLNCFEFWALHESTSATWGLFQKCCHDGIKMDRIFQGLINIRSDGANIIENQLNDIHEFVRQKRIQERLHPSCEPQQNTDSCSSSSGDGFNNDPSYPCSSVFTCRCGSEHYHSPTENNHSLQGNNHYTIPTADMPPLDAICQQYPADLERPQRIKRDRLSQTYLRHHKPAEVHNIQISNPSSDEEMDEVPKKRKASPRAKTYIFITGGNSSREMKTIRERLGSLSRLPYKLIWDSPDLIDEYGQQWERTFSEAALVVIGLTKDYAANVSRGGDWPSRAKQINQYVQRELTNNNHMNKRFISVIMMKSGLKKGDLPCELSGTPYKWPDQDEQLKHRLKEKMDKILNVVR